MEQKNAWKSYDEEQLKKIEVLSAGYKKFISMGKTERECTRLAKSLAIQEGYVDIKELIKNNQKVKEGDKIYAEFMDKVIFLFQIGSEPLENGMNILGAHIDSPRMDIKQNPLYEDSDLAYLDTHYYGGIKKYQWVTIPLAIHGVVAKKDGTVLNFEIGEKDDDPVFGVTDLLIHLAAEQMTKKASVVIEGEDLNLLVGSKPSSAEKDAVKDNILKILKEKYGIEEEDFISAELEVVPAGKARDFGFDRSLILGYGHDDRSCAYTSLMALLQVKNLRRTGAVILVDKEEVGSQGATGMQSRFFENTVAEIMSLTGDYSELKLRRALANSKMISSDVAAGYDPIYASAFEKKNAAFLGKGLVVEKFTGARGKSGASDANAEFLAQIRNIFDEGKVNYHTAELGKVDVGGGGTIAFIMANYGMEVIDMGIPVLSMHAPWELVSKVDVYEALRGYKKFLIKA